MYRRRPIICHPSYATCVQYITIYSRRLQLESVLYYVCASDYPLRFSGQRLRTRTHARRTKTRALRSTENAFGTPRLARTM